MSKEQPVGEELPDELTFGAWQDALRKGRLLGHECGDCGWATSFPRGACDHCGSRDLAVTALPDTGEVYSETQVNVAPEGFDGGYRLALVDLDGVHVLGRIDGDAAIGDTVTFTDVFEREDAPAPVFEPVG